MTITMGFKHLNNFRRWNLEGPEHPPRYTPESQHFCIAVPDSFTPHSQNRPVSRRVPLSLPLSSAENCSCFGTVKLLVIMSVQN